MRRSVWRGWAIADADGRLALDRIGHAPFPYKHKREALLDAEDGQIAVRVVMYAGTAGSAFDRSGVRGKKRRKAGRARRRTPALKGKDTSSRPPADK